MSAPEYFALVRERTAAERTLPILNGKGPVSVLREPPWRCIRAGTLPHVLAALEAQNPALETEPARGAEL